MTGWQAPTSGLGRRAPQRRIAAMKQVTFSAPHAARRRGFTVIELMITMVIVAILVAVALPTFQSAVRKSRRTEAFNALTSIQQAEERHRSTLSAYTTLITEAPTATPPGLGQPGTRTATGYYDLSITLVSGGTTTYVATAAAVSGTSQFNDGDCAVLAVRVQGGNIRYGSGASIDWTPGANTDPQRCWAR
jgi:type IV pilus assembly protein PilE